MDCKQTTDTQPDWHIAKLMNTKKKKSKKANTFCCQYWFPRYKVSILSTICGGCHPKGLIVASSYKIKQTIIIILIWIYNNIPFICPLVNVQTAIHKKPTFGKM